jgi:hypothetical protein
MRKFTLLLLASCLLFTVPGIAAIKKKSSTCPTTLAGCPDDGCSTDHDVDGGLNERKNIRPNGAGTEEPAQPVSLRSIKDLPDPENFSMGDSRGELTDFGEGTKVRVVAYLLRAKPEGKESCNCGLTGVKNTDNHLVLVSRFTVSKFADDAGTADEVFAAREEESITAEFTPRLRLTHPNFTRAKITPLINAAPHNALRVRVTGMLMFDSQHFLQDPLVRVNDWEIHPILKLEYCEDDSCPANFDTGWKSLDDCPTTGCT